MGKIHQLYCTHCTYGSSALERREGDLADRPLGYSVRAGSADRNDLRRYFRDAERFMYYYLPSDEPAEAKLRHDAASAPRRLFYCPSVNNMQLAGQISYRAVDTAGRPGSYFGHVLLWPAGDAGEAALKSLQTWSGRWEDTDSSAIPVTLEPLQDLSELALASAPAITDAVLESFLTAPSGGEFFDPQGVITQRWRETPAEVRESLVKELLQTLVNAGSGRRDSLILAIEPSVAALVFYAVLRLLPPGKLRESIGFSTYEPNPERSLFALAATTFGDPLQTDFKPELYRGRSYVRHTWQNKYAASVRAEGLYAASMLQTLKSDGWAAVDSQLADYGVAGISRFEDLERFAGIRASFENLFLPDRPATELNWKDDLTVRYFRYAAVKALQSDPARVYAAAQAATYRNFQLWLRLLGFEGVPDDIRSKTERLVELWPDLRINELLDWEGVATYFKSLAARRYFQATKFQESEGSPFTSASFWRIEGNGSGASNILIELLKSLATDQRLRLQRIVPRERMQTFLTSLVAVWGHDADALGSLESSVKLMDPETFREFIQKNRDALQKNLPPNPAGFVTRLQGLVNGLLLKPESFSENLEILKPWTAFFPANEEVSRRYSACRELHYELTTLAARRADSRKQLSQWLRKPGNLEIPRAKADHLALLFNDAWPAPRESDPVGSRRTEVFVDLVKQLLDSDRPLPINSLKRIQQFFANGYFQLPSPISLKPITGADSARRFALKFVAGVICCSCLAAGLVIFLKGKQPDILASSSSEPNPVHVATVAPSPTHNGALPTPVASPISNKPQSFQSERSRLTDIKGKIDDAKKEYHSHPFKAWADKLDSIHQRTIQQLADFSKLAKAAAFSEQEFDLLNKSNKSLVEEFDRCPDRPSVDAADLIKKLKEIQGSLKALDADLVKHRPAEPTDAKTLGDMNGQIKDCLAATSSMITSLSRNDVELKKPIQSTLASIATTRQTLASKLLPVLSNEVVEHYEGVHYTDHLTQSDVNIPLWERAPVNPKYSLMRPALVPERDCSKLLLRQDEQGFSITKAPSSASKSPPVGGDGSGAADESALLVSVKEDGSWAVQWKLADAEARKRFHRDVTSHLLRITDSAGHDVYLALFKRRKVNGMQWPGKIQPGKFSDIHSYEGRIQLEEVFEPRLSILRLLDCEITFGEVSPPGHGPKEPIPSTTFKLQQKIPNERLLSSCGLAMANAFFSTYKLPARDNRIAVGDGPNRKTVTIQQPVYMIDESLSVFKLVRQQQPNRMLTLRCELRLRSDQWPDEPIWKDMEVRPSRTMFDSAQTQARNEAGQQISSFCDDVLLAITGASITMGCDFEDSLTPKNPKTVEFLRIGE